MAPAPPVPSADPTPEPGAAVHPPLDPRWLRDVVARALDEDLGGDPGRDLTSEATVPDDVVGAGHVVARGAGVVAGLPAVAEVLHQVSARLGIGPVAVEPRVADGARVTPGAVLAAVRGPVRVLLVGERTLLNLLSHASGIATHTRRWADALAGSGAQVLDTRKTTPGLRALDKYAVRCGGGTNKRMGLYDVAMVKDNHVLAAGGVAEAVAAVRAAFPDAPVQVEADTLEQALVAVDAGARFLLLDNMPPDVLREVVAAVRAREAVTGRVELEATGGLTLEDAPAVAATGVDYLSVGALTHSSPILDVALDLVDDDPRGAGAGARH